MFRTVAQTVRPGPAGILTSMHGILPVFLMELFLKKSFDWHFTLWYH